MSKGMIRPALVALDGLAALTALGGGIALATGLEGERFPVELLIGTPFSSYVLPGLILAVAVGGSATVAGVATWRSPIVGGYASLLAGGVMMGWIVGEVLILRAPEARSWAEAAYFAVGALMAGLGLRLERAERSREAQRPA